MAPSVPLPIWGDRSNRRGRSQSNHKTLTRKRTECPLSPTTAIPTTLLPPVIGGFDVRYHNNSEEVGCITPDGMLVTHERKSNAQLPGPRFKIGVRPGTGW